MKRTITDYLYLILCVQLIIICGILVSLNVYIFDGKFEDSFFIIYYGGFTIVFIILFYKLWKKTEHNWIDKIVHKYIK